LLARWAIIPIRTKEGKRGKVALRGYALEARVVNTSSIKKFLDRGGILVWRITPTNFEPFVKETIDTLEDTENT